MAKKRKRAIPPASLAAYDRLIAARPEIERKGKTVPYTSANGYMFTTLNAAGELGVRLDAEQRRKFLADHDAELFESYGKVMKEFVRIPDALLSDTEALLPYLDASYAHVRGLKPNRG